MLHYFTKSISVVIISLASAFMMTGIANAQSLAGNVGSAGVTDGERGVEFRIGIDDDGNSGSRIHYDHSFTGWYQLRTIASFSRPDSSQMDFSSLTLENWFQWSEEKKDNSGFHGGIRFAYGISDGGPDEAEVRLTLTDKFADGWEWRTNLIGELEAGDGSVGGVELEARAQLSKSLGFKPLNSDSFRLGIETFSEFGNSRDIPDLEQQAHQIGPVIKMSWDNGAYIQSAVRFGVTDGADDAMAKFFIGREF